ncbi:MAG: C25 family cysteine peptidase [Chloroflexi bacterium]|nr:C25 family cysteine peptidase [Chloroflexota bacterium]
MLSGDDMLPDMAVGRIPVNTTSEAENVINKIIWYEQNQLNLTPTGAWQKAPSSWPIEQEQAAPTAPPTKTLSAPCCPPALTKPIFAWMIMICPTASLPEGDMRGDMGEALLDGISLINYRGHGSVQFWGGYGGADMILDASQPDEDLRQFWQNNTKPAVIISADCLDGHFAHTNRTALSERYLRLGELKATAAHWSSSGLGFESEHTPLVSGFYTGLFGQGHTAIGDAINYAKVYYTTTNYHQDELYAFNLQGDPAMQLFSPGDKLDHAGRHK